MKKKIAIFGSTGLVGSNVVKKIDQEKYQAYAPTRKDLDLFNKDQVLDWFFENRVEYVIIAAARVGGIVANSTYPTEFLYENLTIQNNIIMSALKSGVENLIFLGSSCIYPRECPQPIKEEYLLTGPLEKTNKSYALAKIAGIQLCDSIREQYGKNYYSLMPCNLYGPGDNFDLEASHVIPGMIRKIENARDNNEPTLKLLGTGRPLREFLYIEDLADGVIFMLENYKGSEGLINIGSGSEVSIKDLANIVAHAIGYKGEILFDTEGLDGTPRKIMDNSKIESLGWKPRIPLKTGIEETVKWYWDNRDKIRK
jgi:GDP-L-fucose synthase